MARKSARLLAVADRNTAGGGSEKTLANQPIEEMQQRTAPVLRSATAAAQGRGRFIGGGFDTKEAAGVHRANPGTAPGKERL